MQLRYARCPVLDVSSWVWPALFRVWLTQSIYTGLLISAYWHDQWRVTLHLVIRPSRPAWGFPARNIKSPELIGSLLAPWSIHRCSAAPAGVPPAPKRVPMNLLLYNIYYYESRCPASKEGALRCSRWASLARNQGTAAWPRSQEAPAKTKITTSLRQSIGLQCPKAC